MIYNDIIRKLAKEEGTDEKLKSANQIQWLQAMNNIKNSANEQINLLVGNSLDII